MRGFRLFMCIGVLRLLQRACSCRRGSCPDNIVLRFTFAMVAQDVAHAHEVRKQESDRGEVHRITIRLLGYFFVQYPTSYIQVSPVYSRTRQVCGRAGRTRAHCSGLPYSEPPLFRRRPMFRGRGAMTHLLMLCFRLVLYPPLACSMC